MKKTHTNPRVKDLNSNLYKALKYLLFQGRADNVFELVYYNGYSVMTGLY